MIAEPAILEIIEGPNHLIAAETLLPVAIATAHDQRTHVLESRRRTVGSFRAVCAEILRV